MAFFHLPASSPSVLSICHTSSASARVLLCTSLTDNCYPMRDSIRRDFQALVAHHCSHWYRLGSVSPGSELVLAGSSGTLMMSSGKAQAHKEASRFLSSGTALVSAALSPRFDQGVPPCQFSHVTQRRVLQEQASVGSYPLLTHHSRCPNVLVWFMLIQFVLIGFPWRCCASPLPPGVGWRSCSASLPHPRLSLCPATPVLLITTDSPCRRSGLWDSVLFLSHFVMSLLSLCAWAHGVEFGSGLLFVCSIRRGSSSSIWR